MSSLSALSTGLMVVYGAMILWMLRGPARDAYRLHHSDTSNWRYLGMATAVALFLGRVVFVDRKPQVAVAMVLALVLAVGVSRSIEAAVEEMSTASHAWANGNPPPEVSPIKKMELLMPTRVGQHATRGAWPPFMGHKFPLGDQR
ncbi:hypothetical protein ACFSUP_04255 [Gracilibacillus thailandensis]|uniref:hypothetical protein n=1 Tax=Gracilibacillus thailandensis TaxID=563735 RepID=UPI003634CDFE